MAFTLSSVLMSICSLLSEEPLADQDFFSDYDDTGAALSDDDGDDYQKYKQYRLGL